MTIKSVSYMNFCIDQYEEYHTQARARFCKFSHTLEYGLIYNNCNL